MKTFIIAFVILLIIFLYFFMFAMCTAAKRGDEHMNIDGLEEMKEERNIKEE